jgi:hypothetical protein
MGRGRFAFRADQRFVCAAPALQSDALSTSPLALEANRLDFTGSRGHSPARSLTAAFVSVFSNRPVEPESRFESAAAFHWQETCRKKNFWNFLALLRSFSRMRLFA